MEEVAACWQAAGADPEALLICLYMFIGNYLADNRSLGFTEVFPEELNPLNSFEGTGKSGKNTEPKASSFG